MHATLQTVGASILLSCSAFGYRLEISFRRPAARSGLSQDSEQKSSRTIYDAAEGPPHPTNSAPTEVVQRPALIFRLDRSRRAS